MSTLKVSVEVSYGVRTIEESKFQDLTINTELPDFGKVMKKVSSSYSSDKLRVIPTREETFDSN